MSERAKLAARLATRIALWLTPLGFLNGYIERSEESAVRSPWLNGLVVAVFTFAFFFVLTFVFASLFRPNTDDPSLGVRFVGARKVVWPAIVLACAATVYVALSR